ncbi:hypothetical protein [Streptomyces himalayensis]|uniref:Uncharacterized protein n=1 Tax=Streptomyces himalayensis subsp. himalayensis TaxID=2756131 RepID=A0A7W0ID10_9ACTN|nr:hypothetical protein [Streptomyces himalayensis]MBA2950706.1 hypothetical protein [Streptomyces himalayensis subsp. himalayensis]
MMFAATDECRPADPGKLLEKIYADAEGQGRPVSRRCWSRRTDVSAALEPAH